MFDMFDCVVFKGFKRSGNHLIIFNIINNIIGGDNTLEGLSALKPYLFYDHDKKVVFFNCVDAHMDIYTDMLTANITDDLVLKESLISKIDKFLIDNGKDISIEEIRKFTDTKITSEYKILFSIEDFVFTDEYLLINKMFRGIGIDTKVDSRYIIRDIGNTYSSRKKSGWMSIGKEFIDSYIQYYNTFKDKDKFICFNDYVKDSEYRNSIHEQLEINNNILLDRSTILPVGMSSFDNSEDVFERQIDEADKALLQRSDLLEIKKHIK